MQHGVVAGVLSEVLLASYCHISTGTASRLNDDPLLDAYTSLVVT